jgi:septum formation protein
MDNLQLYLASRSPRRRILIEQLGVHYKTLDVDVDERPHEGENPSDYVARLAMEKAKNGWDQVGNGKIPVVGADTCIVFNDQIIGKVDSREQSRALLKQFSANSHQVLTGIAMIGEKLEGNRPALKQRVRVNNSNVTFRALTEEECERYWETGEPVGKAGGYAIQGIAAAFIEKIEGSYSGVMGLPLCELSELMSEFGIKWLKANNKNKQ